MKSSLKLAAAAGIGFLAALALAGCFSSGYSYAIFDRQAEPSDAFPSDLPDYAADDLDPASSRYVTEHEGNALYLVKSSGDAAGGVCLLVYPDNSPDWVVACGGTPDLGVGGPTGDYIVRPDAAPAPEKATQISTNIFVQQ